MAVEENESSKITETDVYTKGFTVVYEPASVPEYDIIFIHGLQGHPYKTWLCKEHRQIPSTEKLGKSLFKFRRSSTKSHGQNDQSQHSQSHNFVGGNTVYWPSDLLQSNFPLCRVLVYGYDSHITHFFSESTTQNNIFSLGRDFLHELAAQKRENRLRPHIIIAHSLGGLVTKDALRRAQAATASEEDRDLALVLQSTLAVMFFGTPHRGSAYAHIGLTASRIVSLAGFSVNTENVRNLKGNSGVLEMLREQFVDILDSGVLRVTTFQEGMGPTRSGVVDTKIVDTESSGLDHRFERKFNLSRNHMDMCRFPRVDDPDYTKVKDEITRHLENWKFNQASERNKYLQPLYIPEMYLRFDQVESAYSNTLSWLFNEKHDGPGFVEWLRDGTDIFWIKGKPGCGKSTVMKYICTNRLLISHLQTGNSAPWAICGLFFTDRGGDAERSWHGMLSIMLYELLRQVPQLKRPLIDFLISETATGGGTSAINSSSVKNDFQWTVELLQRALLFCKQQQSVKFRICFLIDALDEHEGSHQDMAEFLKSFARLTSPDIYSSVKICVSSRPLPELTDLFEECPGFRVQDWTHADVDRYVNGRLRANKVMQRLIFNPDTVSQAEFLITKIIKRANGVFIWVRLVVDELSKRLTDGLPIPALLKLLDEIPDDLNEFFLRMLKKIDVKYKYLAYIILESILRAVWQLSMPQLQSIVAANFEDSNVECELLSNMDDFERQILSYTGGLLEIKRIELDDDEMMFEMEGPKREGFVVQPLHQTINEFLRRPENLESLHVSETGEPRRLEPGCDGDFFLLKAFAYTLELQPSSSEPPSMAMRKIMPQMKQSVINYESKAKELCYPLLSRLEDLYSSSLWLPRNWLPGFPDGWNNTFIAFATYRGMLSFVGEAIHHHSIFWTKPGVPLIFYAALSNNMSIETTSTNNMLDLLLRHGAAANATIKDSDTGIQMDTLAVFVRYGLLNWAGDDAAVPSHWEYTVTKLLEHGADANGRVTPNTTLFFAVAKADLLSKLKRVRIMQKLFEHGALRDETHFDVAYKLVSLDPPLTQEMWRWLLLNGLKITKLMAEYLYSESNQNKDHPLLAPACRLKEFYHWRAMPIAWKHNPEWHREVSKAKMQVQGVGDMVLPKWI